MMPRNFFLLLLAAIAMTTSCSSQHVVPQTFAGAASYQAMKFDSHAEKSTGTPWTTVPLGYTPGLLYSAVLSGKNIVFADATSNLVGYLPVGGPATLYSAGNFDFPQPSAPPATPPADPLDVETGPGNTTYLLSQDGFGITNSVGATTLYDPTCVDGDDCYFKPAVTAGASVNMAVSSDGSAWYSQADASGSKSYIIRAQGATAMAIPAPHPTAYAVPQTFAIGPDGNVWFTEGKLIGTVNVSTNAVTTYSIPSKFSPNSYSGGDLVIGPDGALWVPSCSSQYVLRVTTSGDITGVLFPPTSAGEYPCYRGGHEAIAGNGTMLYFGGGGYLIAGLNTSTDQISTYNLPSSAAGGYGGVQTISMGADGNVWAFLDSSPEAYVFSPQYTISSSPVSLKLKAGKSAKVTVVEGDYTGKFTSAPGSENCATVNQSMSTGAFTVLANSAYTPCFVSFSDSLGSGTVYVPVTVTN